MANVTVGTPAQSLSLVLDTGSSDVWMLSNTADLCTSAELQAENYGGCTGGTYNSNDSSTYKLVDQGGFDITYADGTESTGDYITDNLVLNGNTVKALQMGLAYNTTVGVGIMGIGYDTNEAAETEYPSIIDQLVSQDLIPSKAYSLYLDDLETSTGSILFGGIDTDKYTGALITLPVQPDADTGTISSFTVAWTSLSITGEAGNSTTLTESNFAQPAILDSGTTLTYIPDDLAAEVYAMTGAIDDSTNSGIIYIDCDLRTTGSKVTFNYGFGGSGGPIIKVPIDELIFDLDGLFSESSDGSSSSGPFTNTCAFGLYANGGSTNLLGDTFLRSAYVVYDISNNEIAMAQTNFNATDSNVVEIPASASGIPYVSGVASGVSVSQTATGAPGVGGASTGSASTATKTSSTRSTGSSSSTGSTSTSTKTSGAVGTVPAFEGSSLSVLAISGLFALLGATMIWA